MRARAAILGQRGTRRVMNSLLPVIEQYGGPCEHLLGGEEVVQLHLGLFPLQQRRVNHLLRKLHLVDPAGPLYDLLGLVIATLTHQPARGLRDQPIQRVNAHCQHQALKQTGQSTIMNKQTVMPARKKS